MTTEQKYIHYHVRCQTAIGVFLSSAVFTLENATREAAFKNITDPMNWYESTFCHDMECDHTRRPE